MTRTLFTLAFAAAFAIAAGAAAAADTPTTGTRIKQEAQKMEPIQVIGATRAERNAPLNATEAARPAKADLPTIDATEWTPSAEKTQH